MHQPTVQELNGLFDLASDPVLGQAVKSVSIIAVVFDTTELESMLKSRRKRLRERQGQEIATTTVECTKEELVETQQDLDWLRARIDLRNEEDTDSVIAFLSRVLHHFGNLSTRTVDSCVLTGRDR